MSKYLPTTILWDNDGAPAIIFGPDSERPDRLSISTSSDWVQTWMLDADQIEEVIATLKEYR